MSFILGMAAKIILPVIVKEIIAKNTSSEIAKKIEREIASNPVAVNELSAEAPYQSRVAIGSVVSAIGIVVPTVSKLLGYDVDSNEIVQFLNAIVILWGAGYALYGRFASGLAPLFSKRS